MSEQVKSIKMENFIFYTTQAVPDYLGQERGRGIDGYILSVGKSIDAGWLSVGVNHTSTHYTMAIIGLSIRLASDELEVTCLTDHYITDTRH